MKSMAMTANVQMHLMLRCDMFQNRFTRFISFDTTDMINFPLSSCALCKKIKDLIPKTKLILELL